MLDRTRAFIPSAVAEKASLGMYLRAVQAGVSKGGYPTIRHDFSLRKSRESARRIIEKQLDGMRAAVYFTPKKEWARRRATSLNSTL